jgi:hypothetical protein
LQRVIRHGIEQREASRRAVRLRHRRGTAHEGAERRREPDEAFIEHGDRRPIRGTRAAAFDVRRLDRCFELEAPGTTEGRGLRQQVFSLGEARAVPSARVLLRDRHILSRRRSPRGPPRFAILHERQQA